MSTIICFANNKGGVGKSTLTMNLGGALSEIGKQTLVVDLDPQANLTSVFVDNGQSLALTVADIIYEDTDIDGTIRATKIDNLALLPSSSKLQDIDSRLAGDDDAQFFLAEELQAIKGLYDFIDSIKRVGQDTLDWIIQLNDLEKENYRNQNKKSDININNVSGYGLPVCIRRMLNEGVTFNQRVACFRIAVHLKRVGLPYDAVIATLMDWRLKNRPQVNKRIITPEEIEEQVGCAFKKDYSGYGCSEPIIESFCDPQCPVILKNK